MRLAIPTGNPTTLAAEVSYLKSLTDDKLKNYRPAAIGTLAEQLLSIMLTMCDQSLRPEDENRDRILASIQHHIDHGSPIVLTVTFALGIRAPNVLKFNEPANLPTLGWLHWAWYFDHMNQKVKAVYAPGIEVVVFEEGSLFGDLFGISTEAVYQLNRAARQMFAEFKHLNIRLIPLTTDMFAEASADNVYVPPAVVYAVACSLPEMKNREFFDPIYRNRKRDHEALREMEPVSWRHAERIAYRIAECLAWRKQVGLFDKLLGVPYIDSTVTEKGGRLVLSVTSGVMINHGQPLVHRDTGGKYSVKIIPESRMYEEHPHATPVLIAPAEFGMTGSPYTFYYKNGVLPP